MTYAEFLGIFLVVPLLVLLTVAHGLSRRLALTLAGVSLLAVLYTGPWDNLIVMKGVWSYGPGRVWGLVIGHVPLEEYAFYVLQVFLAGTLTAMLLRSRET